MARSPYLSNLRQLNLSHADFGSDSACPGTILDSQAAGGAGPQWLPAHRRDLGRHPGVDTKAGLRWLRLSDADLISQDGGYLGPLWDVLAYRAAFEEAAETVDWDSPYFSPHDAGNWVGQSWHGRSQQQLFAMARFIQKKDYKGLENRDPHRLCRDLCGEEVTREIEALDFGRFQASLQLELPPGAGRPGPQSRETGPACGSLLTPSGGSNSTSTHRTQAGLGHARSMPIRLRLHHSPAQSIQSPG